MARRKATNHKAITINKNMIIEHPVYDYFDTSIEIEDQILNVNESEKFINDKGGITFVFNLPDVAAVEASNLFKLRRSMAIKRIFDYDKEKPTDVMKLLLLFALIISIIFG